MGNSAESMSAAADPERLRERVAELEAALAASHAREHMLRQLIDGLPSAISIIGRDGYIHLVNLVGAAAWGGVPADFEGHFLHEHFPPDLVGAWMREQAVALNARESLSSQQMVGEGDAARYYAHLRFPIRDTAGTPVAVAGSSDDITDRVRAEREREAMQNQIIAAQRAALRELSTPLIPIAAGVVVMPLIGNIDSARAGQVVETLLAGVSTHRARFAILDITGLPLVDSQVANVLLQAAQAVRLLGAEVLLTGVRPEVAQTLVGIGADLSGIATPGTLQDGIAVALRRA